MQAPATRTVFVIMQHNNVALNTKGGGAVLHVDFSKRLGSFTLAVSLELACSGITALFGPSGAGKSTFAKILAGLCTPDCGRISANGRVFFDSAAGVNLPPEKRGIGFLFQEHRLFPHMTVLENISFGRLSGRRPHCGAPEEIAEIFGIGGLLGRRPASLSGGESQRAALARAILAAENFIIMDEPLSSLDEARRGDLMGYIERIPRLFGIPVIYITHSREEVFRLAESVVLIEQGRATGFGSPSEVMPQRQRGTARD